MSASSGVATRISHYFVLRSNSPLDWPLDFAILRSLL